MEFEAESEEEAQELGRQWYKEQKKDWKEPTVEMVKVMPAK